MAKATTAKPAPAKSTPAKSTSARQSQGKRTPAAPERQERGGSLSAIYQELRKVTWPTWRELGRMTQVVAATVVIFAFFIGGLDLLLSVVAKPLYTQQGTSAPTRTLSPQTVPTLPPSQGLPVPSGVPSAAAPSAAAPGAPAPAASPKP